MMNRLSAPLVAVSLLLSSCAVGPEYRREAFPVSPLWSPRQSRGTNTSEPAERWWTSFNDPRLDNLVQEAVQANLDMKLAAARVAEARAERGVAASGLYPSVGAAVSATRNRQRVIAPAGGAQAPASPVPVEFNNFQIGFDASWELDVFGRIRRGFQAASADAAAAEEARRETLVTVLGEVGRSYAELRGFQLRLDIARKNIRIQQDTLELTKTRAAAGLATQLDVARASAQLETTRAVAPALRSGLETSIHRLSVLLGKEPGAFRAGLLPGAPVPVTPPEVPVGLPSELLERRPDIRRAEAQVAAETARVGESKADFFPRFVLSGNAGRQASQLHDITLGLGNFFGVGPAVSLPIFTGGQIRSRVRVQEARLRQAVIAYRATVLSALEETEDALVGYAQERTRREHLESAVTANGESVRLSSELYRAGLTDFLSVLDAQRELYADEDLLAQSRTAQTIRLIALYKALGGGWQSFPQLYKQRKGERHMKYLVRMKLADSARPTTAEAGIAFVEQFILPTLEMCNKLESEKKILAGGPVSGTVALALIVSAESIQELDELITGLPIWPRMETEVTALTSFEGRMSSVRPRLQQLRSIGRIADGSDS